MKKEEIKSILDAEIETIGKSYLCELEHPDGETTEHSQEIVLKDGWWAEVIMSFYGKFHTYEGDHDSPPCETGTWSWEVEEIKIYDEFGELQDMEFDLSEFSGNDNY